MRTRQVLVILVLGATVAGALVDVSASAKHVTNRGSTVQLASSAKTHFDPTSVTFISIKTGWVIGTEACAPNRTCVALRETTDGGHTWLDVALAASLSKAADHDVGGFSAATYFDAGLNVRFANTRDGWIYGTLAATVTQGSQSYVANVPKMWSTHDGGLVWRPQTLTWAARQGSIYDLETANGVVYVMAQNKSFGATVESSPVAQDNWRPSNSVALGSPAGGGQPTGAIVLKGSSGWLVEGNDRANTGSARLTRDGRWVAWTPPCASVGGGLAVPAAASARNLVAVCGMGGFASPQPSSAPRGAAIGSSWFYSSRNGGTTFTIGSELKPVPANLSFGNFTGVLASPRPGELLVGRSVGLRYQLIASFDGGVRWRVVYHGRLSYLGFTSAAQGVALVQGANRTNSMIMTYDGGRKWLPVSF